MAAITAVASACASGVQPRYDVGCPVTVYSEYTITATMTTGNVVRICKVPDKARIINIACGIPNTFHVNAKLSFGTSADHDAYIASATCSTARIINMNSAEGVGGGLAAQLDISDAATTRYTEIRMTVSDADSTTGTTAGTLKFLVTYMNDQGPY